MTVLKENKTEKGNVAYGAFPKLLRAQNDSNQATFYPEQLNEKADEDGTLETNIFRLEQFSEWWS